MKKPKITKQEIYVCRLVGKPNGYGNTLKEAYSDHVKRTGNSKENKLNVRVLKEAIRVEKGKNIDLESQINELQKLTEWPNISDVEQWLLMACWVFNCNPNEALGRMERFGKVKIGAKEVEAKEKLYSIRKHWVSKLGLE